MSTSKCLYKLKFSTVGIKSAKFVMLSDDIMCVINKRRQILKIFVSDSYECARQCRPVFNVFIII